MEDNVQSFQIFKACVSEIIGTKFRDPFCLISETLRNIILHVTVYLLYQQQQISNREFWELYSEFPHCIWKVI